MIKARSIAMMTIFVLSGFVFLPQSARAYYSQDLVVNGGFETDPLGNGWQQVPPSGDIGVWTGTIWHGGSRGAKMGNYSSAEFVTQDIAVPSDISSATFSGWYALFSSETFAGYDTLVMVAYNKNDVTDQFCNFQKDPAVDGATGIWTKLSCDITAAKGKTITIVFGITNDASLLSMVNVDDVSVVIEKPDTTAPTTTLVSNPSVPNGNNLFYTIVPSITLSASDDANGSGVNKIFYNWDGGSYVEYISPISAPQGTHTLYYYSSDKAGNIEAAKTAVFKVDTNKPSVNAALSIGSPDGANGWYKTMPTITLSASDGSDGSGVDVVRYRWDGGGNLLYTGALGASEGVHTLSFSTIDKAGNNSDEASIVVKVDATDLILTLLDSNYQQTVNTASVIVKGTVSDNGSGIASVTVNGIPTMVDPAGNFSSKVDLKQGNNIITVVATDNAGRSVSASRTIVYKKGQVLGDSVVRPIIRKISPNSTAGVKIASANQKVKVIGSNFKKSAKVKVGKLTIKTSKFRNSTFIEITIPLSKLKKGKHDVTVTNPDGQTMTLKKGFTKR